MKQVSRQSHDGGIEPPRRQCYIPLPRLGLIRFLEIIRTDTRSSWLGWVARKNLERSAAPIFIDFQ